MLARFLADVVVLVHLAFVLFVLFGGTLVARWSMAAWVHLPCAAYGVAVEVGQWVCPLTPLENELRRRGGEAGYGGGFVEHYILPVLYPSPRPAEVTWVLAGIVVSVNVVVYGKVLLRKRRRARPSTSARCAGLRSGRTGGCMDVKVDCYAGYRGEETPRRFEIEGRRVEVVEVIDRWLGTDHRYFKLRGDDGAIYLLRHDEPADRWELKVFERDHGR